MKLNIPPIDMKAQRVKKIRSCSLELKKDYFIYKVDFDLESLIDPEDELLGWEDETTTFTTVVRKSTIVFIEKSLTDHNQWCVFIGTGADDNTKLFFTEDGEQKADAILNILVAWTFEDSLVPPAGLEPAPQKTES